MEKLRIYTDGACSGNPGAGGWAAVLLYGDKKKEISGFDPATTNNRMELLAAIKGLCAVKPISDGSGAQVLPEVELYSDSAYLVNAIKNGWIESWQKNNWRTSDRKDVKNKDLWLQLIELNKRLAPNYVKVKGHGDNVYNNRADALAVAAVRDRKTVE